MNERIRELAEQNGFIHKWMPPGEQHDKLQSLEKFAQLIALECARLAMTEHHSTSPADYGDMDAYEQGCDDTASAISGKIRRTFGVE